MKPVNQKAWLLVLPVVLCVCLLYTSDAADE